MTTQRDALAADVSTWPEKYTMTEWQRLELAQHLTELGWRNVNTLDRDELREVIRHTRVVVYADGRTARPAYVDAEAVTDAVLAWLRESQ